MPLRKLLCVDDDPLFRHLYRTLFGSLGYEVTVAADGEQALAELRKRQFDAVLTDFRMPGMNGHQLALRLKQARPDLPVMLLSGLKELPAEVRDAADVCLEKGTPVYQLAERLEELLAARAALHKPFAAVHLLPIGSILATVALAAYLLPRK
jgi:CheY-like chemotaxis protein